MLYGGCNVTLLSETFYSLSLIFRSVFDTLILSVKKEACFLTPELGLSSPTQENVEWDQEGAQQNWSSTLRKQQLRKHPNYC